MLALRYFHKWLLQSIYVDDDVFIIIIMIMITRLCVFTVIFTVYTWTHIYILRMLADAFLFHNENISFMKVLQYDKKVFSMLQKLHNVVNMLKQMKWGK